MGGDVTVVLCHCWLQGLSVATHRKASHLSPVRDWRVGIQTRVRSRASNYVKLKIRGQNVDNVFLCGNQSRMDTINPGHVGTEDV